MTPLPFNSLFGKKLGYSPAEHEQGALTKSGFWHAGLPAKTMAALGLALAFGVAPAAENGSPFQARELSLSLFGAYLDTPADKFAAGIGLDYYLTRNLGVGGVVQLVDELRPAAEAYFRLPLGTLSLAPYAVGTAGYRVQTSEWFQSVGGGAEWRFRKNLSLFGDFQWQFNDDTKDGAAVRVGLRLGL